MNLPNFLTIIRMVFVPVFIVLFYQGIGAAVAMGDPAPYLFMAFAVFIVASLTDALDGYIARKNGLITNFGKLMDPLADKILTTSAFIVFVDVGTIPAWMVIVILAREFAITGLRGVAAAEGTVIAAGFSGKLKTVLQMAAICIILLGFAAGDTFIGILIFEYNIGLILMYAAVVMTVWSGIEYLWRGRNLLNMK